MNVTLCFKARRKSEEFMSFVNIGEKMTCCFLLSWLHLLG